MSKQNYQPCHGPRKRSKYSNINDRSLKKNKQILETYLVATPKSRASSVFQIVDKRKPQTLKKRPNERYYLVNPKAKLLRSSKTQLSDHEDEYLEELRSLKSQIKDLQKDIQEKRLQQYEDQYLSQIRNIKSEIIQLKSLTKGNSDRKLQQEEFLNDIHGIKDQIRELKKQFKEKRSPGYLPPIHIYPSVNLNPQNISLPNRKNSLKKSQKNKRPSSISANHQDQLEELRQEVDDLKRQMLLSKNTKYGSSIYSPSVSRINDRPNQHSKSQKIKRKSQSNPRLQQRSGTIYSKNNKDQSPQEIMWRKNVRKQAIKKIKKATNAILFVNRLQKFSQKIRLKRQNFFKESFKDGLLNQVKAIRDAYVKATLQFTNGLPINDPQSSVVIVPTDNQSQRITKAGLVRKCINKFLDAIKQTQFLPNIMQTLTETCYFVCRHGSAGVLSNYFTAEELDIMCISKGSLKVMAEKNLEKSQIISFIWVKLIIFNILLRTQSVPQLKLEKNAIWNANFCLFGSIIYELCRKIQAEMLERVPMHYVIGNWKHLNFLNSKNGSKFKVINPSKSMTINLKQHQKTFKTQEIPNELLQGTVSKKYLSDAYEYQSWQAQIRRISNYIQLIHRRVCKYHAKLKEQLL